MAVARASDKYKEFRKEVSRLAQVANKRIARLEKNNLTELPAYRAWEKNGSIHFSVKGKSYQELQSEYWKIKNLLDDVTSTVKGANKYLKEIAQNTGIKYNGVKDLKKQLSNFFRLADKIKEYYSSIGQSAQALAYQKIWQQINLFVKSSNVDMSQATSSEDLLYRYLNQIEKLDAVENGEEGYLSGAQWDWVDID
jgi:hypothetical protein